eukprot:TRINITY_DN3524_c0_g1_i1.p1 TRINITY_DN3524_c0_g1~~TRINITY_DN3524_c0_g1_i1.p1  ORF type:complete len:490 (+),score=82.65 TRINITY_DN3524_c0_g1_i1:3075-4544(+)
MERLLIAFPLKSRKELEMIDSYIEYERWARKKSDSLRRQVMAKKQELQQKVELMLRTDVENMKVDIEQKLDLLKQEAKLRKIKQLHEENVEKYQDKIAVINALQERKKKEEKEELERKEEEWKEHVEEVKMKAVEFKEEKAKKKWMQEQEVRYRQQMLKEEMKRRIEENKDKVDERNLAEMEKLEKRLVDKANTEREKEEYKEKLNTAIENYKFRPKVEADEKRLEQFTEAMMIRKDTAMDQGDNIKLFKDYGYNTDQLMKDLRFKISTVLAVLLLLIKNIGARTDQHDVRPTTPEKYSFKPPNSFRQCFNYQTPFLNSINAVYFFIYSQKSLVLLRAKGVQIIFKICVQRKAQKMEEKKEPMSEKLVLSDEIIRLFECKKKIPGASSTVNSLCFSKDDRQLFAGSNNETVSYFDTTTGKKLQSLHNAENGVSHVRYLDDTNTILCASTISIKRMFPYKCIIGIAKIMQWSLEDNRITSLFLGHNAEQA